MRRFALVALAGCFSPRPPSGAACAIGDLCPSGLSCIANVCTTGTSPATDASFAAPFAPSNGIDPTLVEQVSAPITMFGDVSLDTDTGEIQGSLERSAGEGFRDGIVFAKQGAIGVFVFASLTVSAGAKVVFTGANAAAFLVGHDATISGAIDGGGGLCTGDPTCAGPGGGAGSLATATPGGCGPGGGGVTNTPDNSDSGGGGGAGGGNGASGGASGPMYPGGSGGTACLAADLVPLVGGSGGAGGGTGGTTPARGGGGGGALQISAFGQLTVTGSISMGGAGGGEGFLDSTTGTGNGSAGAGGGAGGGILLEAPAISLGAHSILAANGGGGGAAGNSSTANGTPGARGGANDIPAAGGTDATNPPSNGGTGGAGTTPPMAAVDAGVTDNGGGGGGGVGAIYIRTAMPMQLVGVQSPPAGAGSLP